MFELFPDENQSYEGMQEVFNRGRCTVAQLPTYTIKHVNIQHILTWGLFMYHCNIYVKRFYFNMGLIYVSLQHIYQTILF